MRYGRHQFSAAPVYPTPAAGGSGSGPREPREPIDGAPISAAVRLRFGKLLRACSAPMLAAASRALHEATPEQLGAAAQAAARKERSDVDP